MIAFEILQRQFRTLHEQGAIPTRVTMTRIDIVRLVAEQCWPDWPESGLMPNYILDMVDGRYIPLEIDPKSAEGTFGMEWTE